MTQAMHKRKTRFVTVQEGRTSCKWFLFNAQDKTLGRFASEISKVLRGKHKLDFTPHIDCGDGVIIINADKIKVTGLKEAQKIYRRYTGSMGGLRETSYRTMLQKNPTYIIRHAVEGMMPKTRLSRKQLKKLRVFAGERHDMQAQQPILTEI